MEKTKVLKRSLIGSVVVIVGLAIAVVFLSFNGSGKRTRLDVVG